MDVTFHHTAEGECREGHGHEQPCNAIYIFNAPCACHTAGEIGPCLPDGRSISNYHSAPCTLGAQPSTQPGRLSSLATRGTWASAAADSLQVGRAVKIYVTGGPDTDAKRRNVSAGNALCAV